MGAKITQKITPFLWFDSEAEEAMNYYLSIFKMAGSSATICGERTKRRSGGPVCPLKADT